MKRNIITTKRCENLIKQMLVCGIETNFEIYNSTNDLINKINNIPELRYKLAFLKAKGFVEYQTDMLGNVDNIHMLDPLITYFSDKRDKRIETIKNWSFNIFIAILSSVVGAILARISLILFP